MNIFKTISERRSFNEWNGFKALEFRRYNETERLILYFRLHLKILNRKEIPIKTGIYTYFPALPLHHQRLTSSHVERLPLSIHDNKIGKEEESGWMASTVKKSLSTSFIIAKIGPCRVAVELLLL